MTFSDWLILNQHTDDITRAIESLRPTTDYVKDYIFPVTMAFASAFLGGVSAVYINRRQELKTISKDCFVAANNTFLMAEECLRILVNIKSGYVGLRTTEPLLRAIRVPPVVAKLDDVTFSTSTLYFIRAIPTANKTRCEALKWYVKHRLLKKPVESPPSETLRKSWRNPVRVSMMFYNYNQVMKTLRGKNVINDTLRQKIPAYYEGPETIRAIHEKLGASFCKEFIDATEASIAITDHVITELNSFLHNFPAIAESNIEMSRISEWGRLPIYENDTPAFQRSLAPIMKPNFERVAAYLGATVEFVQQIYTYKGFDD